MRGNLVRGLALLLGVAFTAGMISRCARGNVPAAASSEHAASVDQPARKELRQSDYGENWPFVRPSATIVCVPAASGAFPAVELGGARYAFTGSTAALCSRRSDRAA